MKRTRRGCVQKLAIALVSIILTAFSGEYLLLRGSDPLGLYSRAVDNQAVFSLSRSALHGLKFTPGDYQFRTFHAVINDDGFRKVQGNRGGDCTIAFIGDSVTFGFGSDTTFVDLLAPDIPVVVRNLGIPGYNIDNILKVVELIPADGYIYLIIENDGDAARTYQPVRADDVPAAWQVYASAWNGQPFVPAKDVFAERAAPLLGRDDVLSFAFAGRGLTDVIQREFPQVQVIPYYTKRVSWADSHPSAEGHAQIAASMKDAVIRFAEQRCLRKIK